MSTTPINTSMPSNTALNNHSTNISKGPSKPSVMHGLGSPLYNLNEAKFFYPIILIIVALLVILGVILSGTNPNTATEEIGKDNSANKIAGDIFLVICICLLIL